MIRIGKVISTDDEKKLGRVKVEIIPELQEFPENLLPWAVPVQRYNSADDFRLDLPTQDSYILVDVNDTWTQFSYDGSRPYCENQDLADAAYKFLKDNFKLGGDDFKPDTIEFSSDPDYMKFKDSVSGIAGLLFSNGRFVCWTGKSAKTLAYGFENKKYIEIFEDGSFTYNNQKTNATTCSFSGDGKVSITCLGKTTIEMDNTQVKINGDNLVVAK